MRLLSLVFLALVTGLTQSALSDGGAGPAGKSGEPPITAVERASAAKLTRLRSARFRWDKANRVVGASFKGVDANNAAVALASNLPKLRTIVLVALNDNDLTDDGLIPVARLGQLELISIAGSRITDAGLVHITQLASLKTLILNGPFSDEGISSVAHLSQLEQLDLSQTRITDQGLTNLAGLANLHTLILNGTNITGQGIAQLVAFKKLDRLYLSNTPLDDSAVEHLKLLTNLELLVIRDTGITAAGVDALLAVLSSDCEVIHQTGTYRGKREAGIAMARSDSSPEQSWHPAR